MRGERLASLTKELEEMATDGRSDADLTALRRAKHDLELKAKDQVSLGKKRGWSVIGKEMIHFCYDRKRNWTSLPAKSKCLNPPAFAWKCQWSK